MKNKIDNEDVKDKTTYNISREQYQKDINNDFKQLFKEITDDVEVTANPKPQQTVKEVFNTRIK